MPPSATAPPRATDPTPVDALMGAASLVVIMLCLRTGLHRLDGVPRRPRPFSGVSGLVLFAAMLIAGMVGAGIAQVAGGPLVESAPPLARPAVLMLGAFGAQLAVAAVYAAMLKTARRPEPDRRRSRAGAIASGLLALAGWWPLVAVTGFLAAFTWSLVTGTAAEPVAHETLRLLREGPRDVWFLLVAVLVVAAVPLTEEILYRGIVQQGLRQLGYGPWPAIAMTSGLFAVMHLGIAEPYAVASLFVLSLGFGWVYERTGRLVAPIVMHGAFNLVNLSLATL